jgi:hypothetical protein
MIAFAGEPQPVEIHHRGIWYSGELLGWRHESDDRVSARVRCVVDGLRHSTWKDLAELRLPDPRRPPRAEAFPAVPAPRTSGSAGSPEDDDATRPHVLLPGMRTRPGAPDHARTPPPRTPDRRAAADRAVEPFERTRPAPGWGVPVERALPAERRRTRREPSPAELSAV